MLTNRSSRWAVVAFPVAVLLLLTACGSSQSAPPVGAPGINGQTAADGGDDFALPDCTGLDPQVCETSGFDPSVNGFSFANWAATGSIDATALVALFGQDAVCAEVTDSGCTLFPAAEQWAAQVNEAMTGGHCEGMAVLSQRIFADTSVLTGINPTAANTFALSKDDPAVTQSIEFWWTTQMFPPVQDAFMAYHDKEPTEIVQALQAGLAEGTNYTMAIYSETGAGHSVTPIAVTFDGTAYAIAVYDNNLPGTVQHVMIDPATERWSYAAGASSPDAPTNGWAGGMSTIDLTPMAIREVPTAAPFSVSDAKGSVDVRGQSSNLLVTSAEAGSQVGFTLTIDGKTYDTTDPAVELPDGVIARPLLGAGLAGNGVNVTIDRDVVASFEADGIARSRDSGEVAPDTAFTMSIDTPGAPRVTVRTQTAADPRRDPVFRADEQGRVDVAPPPGRGAQVNVANGQNSLEAPIPDGGGVRVGPNDSRGGAVLDFRGGQGPQPGPQRIEQQNADGRVVNSTGAFDPQTGQFEVRQRAGRPERVDTGQVEQFRAMAAPAPTGPNQNGGPTGDQGGAGPTGDGQGPAPSSGTGGGQGPAPAPGGGTGGGGQGPAPAPTPAPDGNGGGGQGPAPTSGGGGGGQGPAPAPTSGGGGGGGGQGPAPAPDGGAPAPRA